MSSELDILRIVSDRLGQQRIPFMLTGSYAMACSATPRMTRDLDLVVALEASAVERLRAASDMFDTARAIVESSLPSGLTRHERRLALVRRIYGDELSPAAQEAFARHAVES
ncbi:MAG: hypothetical protein ACRES3_01095 [Steroidobacteraceae bacterium]